MSSTTKDDAELLRTWGEYDGERSLCVYYRIGAGVFRARLRPTETREALTLVALEYLDVNPEDPDYDAEPAEEFEISHVPPLVRGAVERPVQVPEEEGRTW